MRIIIDDSQEIDNDNSAQLAKDSVQLVIDAGQPMLSSNESQIELIEQAIHAEEAGSPPPWLLETIDKAFAQDPGRFDMASEALDQVNDGGSAPSFKS
jgi:Mg2+ and Co2+ transporter CorA